MERGDEALRDVAVIMDDVVIARLGPGDPVLQSVVV
jgi:hypothetical protein